jgi:hypothetical protein
MGMNHILQTLVCNTQCGQQKAMNIKSGNWHCSI